MKAVSWLPRLLLRIPVPWVFVLTYLVGVVLEATVPIQTRHRVDANAMVLVGAFVFSIGAFLAGWGLVTFRRARTTLLPLVLVYVNWVVIPLEQRKLSEAFGEEYARYQARVGRWL